MARRRDSADFEAFAVSRYRSLFRYAYLLVGERGLADDLVQEALTKTYVAWPKLTDTTRVEAYTFKAITNTAISWWRRKSWTAERPRDDIPVTAASPGHADDNVAARLWLWAEVRTLPTKQRAALVLRYYEDLSEAETAQILGCSVGTVKSQTAQALKKLRQRLGPEANLIMETVVA